MKKTSVDTIFALSTCFGPSAIAVIRISGQKCREIAKKICGKRLLTPRYAHFSSISDLSGKLIDKGIVIYFKAPESFTGEDILEIQTHGSIVVINKILDVLSNFPNTRMAFPGEFSKRAYANQKGNILYFEGINNLIAAETENQKIVATNQTFGKSSNICINWRKRILENLAIIDAEIDFSEEDAEIKLDPVKKSLNDLLKEIKSILERQGQISKIKYGMTIMVFGPTNTGKSELFNILCNEDKMIVSSEKGTTRDQSSANIKIKDTKINLIDSAGIRETSDVIEKKGVKKTKRSLEDLVNFILLLSPDTLNKKNIQNLKKIIEELDEKKIVLIFNKSDLKQSKQKNNSWLKVIPKLRKLKRTTISCKNIKKDNSMLLKVHSFLNKNLIAIDSFKNDDYFFSEKRQLECIKRVKDNIEDSMKNINELEISANFLRNALLETDNLYGLHDNEKKLEYIFKNFCIGK